MNESPDHVRCVRCGKGYSQLELVTSRFGGDPMWIGVCSDCEDYNAYDEEFVLMDEDYFRTYAESVTAEPVAPARTGPPGGWGGLIASGVAGFVAGLLGKGRPRGHC